MRISEGISAGAPGQLRWPVTTIGLLAIIGIFLAGYMTYTDLYLRSVPICGGIGDCEAVHTSPYAYIVGVPVAALGLLSYLAIAMLVAVRLWWRHPLEELAALGTFFLVLCGSIFSAYLTYIEFFVIYAFCPWCIASAVTIWMMLIIITFDLLRQYVTD